MIPSRADLPGGSARRISRRAAIRAGGLGAAGAAVFAGGVRSRASAQEATPTAATGVDAWPEDGLAVEVLAAFDALPGTKALKFWAPPDAGRPEWSASLQPGRQMVIASAFKGFVLAEFLRQAEEAVDPASSTPVAAQLGGQLAEELDLDESVFSLGSTFFNPPNLTGKVTARATLDAMVIASDNTATDMILRHVGPDRVRAFIASLGLEQTRIPDSTRQFTAYIFGAPDWRTITWPELVRVVDESPYPPRPALNDESTMASSANDLVALYARGLTGEIFRYPESLATFRGTLSLSDTIARIVPLGLNAFIKAGSLDAFGHHVLSVAGGMYAARAQRWVYFAMLLNWDEAEGGDVASVGPAFTAATNTIFTLVRDRLPG